MLRSVAPPRSLAPLLPLLSIALASLPACGRDPAAAASPATTSRPPEGSGVGDASGPVDRTAPGDAGGGAVSDAAPDAVAPRGDASPLSPPDPYDPCPKAGTPCVVMPLGDSITFGIASTHGAGYRLALLRKVRARGHDVTFVGSSTSGPATLDGKPFPTANEGHSGYTIDDAPAVQRIGISTFVPTWLATYKPNVVALMIGTNDVYAGNDLDGAPARLGHLLDTITALRPEALVVVATLVPSTDDALDAKVWAYNAALPAVVDARRRAGKHVNLVDMYGPMTRDPSFKKKLYDDELHPNDAGFVVMADVWYAALGGLFR